MNWWIAWRNFKQFSMNSAAITDIQSLLKSMGTQTLNLNYTLPAKYSPLIRRKGSGLFWLNNSLAKQGREYETHSTHRRHCRMANPHVLGDRMNKGQLNDAIAEGMARVVVLIMMLTFILYFFGN